MLSSIKALHKVMRKRRLFTMHKHSKRSVVKIGEKSEDPAKQFRSDADFGKSESYECMQSKKAARQGPGVCLNTPGKLTACKTHFQWILEILSTYGNLFKSKIIAYCFGRLLLILLILLSDLQLLRLLLC